MEAARFLPETAPQTPAGVVEAIFAETETQENFAVIGKGPVKQLVEITDENHHLTLFNTRTGQTEVAYQGSHIVVAALELYSKCKPQETRSRPRLGTLSFFDRLGKFHNFVRLESVHLSGQASSIHNQKHVAVFSSGGNTERTRFSVDISDIYCVTWAAHPVIGDEHYTDYDDS